MNLREEIRNYIQDIVVPEGETPKIATDDIMIMIEKRIDERIKKMENPDWWYSNLPKTGLNGIYDSQMILLKEIKELLK